MLQITYTSVIDLPQEQYSQVYHRMFVLLTYHLIHSPYTFQSLLSLHDLSHQEEHCLALDL